MCLKWAAKQEEIKKKGLVDKEIANVALDRRKTKDLEKLKCMSGPFTMSSQVDEYLKSDDSNKVERLYMEVRYARDTSLSMPKNSDIFRLMKDQRRLSEETYATNLKLYLDNVVSIADVTMDDLDRAIDTFTQHDECSETCNAFNMTLRSTTYKFAYRVEEFWCGLKNISAILSDAMKTNTFLSSGGPKQNLVRLNVQLF